jgi:hypothetical protein
MTRTNISEIELPTPNVPLLRKLVEWVEWQDSLPDIDNQWNQGDYVLDEETRAVVLLAGCSIANATDRQVQTVAKHCGSAYCAAGYVGQLLDERYAFSDMVNGLHVADFARHQLGITVNQSAQLFSAGNSPALIRLLCERFAGEPL